MEGTVTELAPQDPLVGRVLGGHYRITALIGQGGMSRVYKATQAPLDRPVALKLLKDDSKDPSLHKRFLFEASVTSKLTHPNTIRIFDYGADQGLLFFAMELLRGCTLSEALKREGRFTEERTVHIARQICRSLREAHGQGLVHRDLKPSNLYLLEQETDFVKVLDFGLVKVFSGEEDLSLQLTAGGLVMGTPHYMAPEQARGKPCDQRADVYSLGIVLYQMLAGRVPYDGASMVDVHVRHATEAVPMLRLVNAEVSEQMEGVVARCMAKKPEARFQNMDEVLMALPGDRPNSSRPPPLSPTDFEVDDVPGSPCSDTSQLRARGDTQRTSGQRKAISHSHPSMKQISRSQPSMKATSHAHPPPPPPPDEAYDDIQPPPQKKRSFLFVAAGAVAVSAVLGVTVWLRPWSKPPVAAAVAAPIAATPAPQSPPPAPPAPATAAPSPAATPASAAPSPAIAEQPAAQEPLAFPAPKIVEAAPIEVKVETPPPPPRKPGKVASAHVRPPVKAAPTKVAAATSEETIAELSERLGRATSGIRQCGMIAHRNGGTVSVRITVEPTGQISQIKISGGEKLDACIETAIRRVKFDPFEGTPVALQRSVTLLPAN
jgi:serine/threonine-protein kinase